MAAVTFHCDFGAQENENFHCFYFSPSICHEVMGPDVMILVFWMLSFKLAFSPSFHPIKSLFSSPLISAIMVISSAYLRLLLFLLAILIPACDSSSLAFCTAYKLNRQGDNKQPWCTPFPILNQSLVLCLVQTVAFWPAYRFLRRHVRWSGTHLLRNFPQFFVIHIDKGISIVSDAEVDIFSETLLLFLWFNGCWQFDLLFLCLF